MTVINPAHNGRSFDKVTIITGGSKGIGEGCARVFCAAGAKVVICARGRDAGERMAAELSAKGPGECHFEVCDVTEPEQIRELVEKTVQRYGRLDCLINNAGTHISKTVFDHTEDEWDLIINTNLKGYFLCVKAVLPHLVAAKGNIINMSSMVGLVGQSRAVAYAASKGGIVTMTRALALDLAPHGVRVNCICPGWVETPLVEDWFNQQPDPEEARRYIYSVHPLGRIATVEEVGEAAAFLASDAASFITGIALPVDGAVTLGY